MGFELNQVESLAISFDRHTNEYKFIKPDSKYFYGYGEETLLAGTQFWNGIRSEHGKSVFISVLKLL